MSYSIITRLKMFTIVAAATVCLCSCASRQAPFNETEFASATRTGNSSVKGLLYRTLKDNTTEVQGARATVYLIPVNAYTQEHVQRSYNERVWIVDPDRRMSKYIRTTHPDEEGHFSFQNVAPGNYYVSSRALWYYPDNTYDGDGNLISTESEATQWLWAKVTLKNGKTSIVNDWNQGK